MLNDKVDCKDKQNTERFAEIERKMEESDDKLREEVLKKVKKKLEKMGSKLKDVRKNQDAKNVEIEKILKTAKEVGWFNYIKSIVILKNYAGVNYTLQ